MSRDDTPLVPSRVPDTAAATDRSKTSADPGFAAQVLGAGAMRRGLRAGAEALEAAKSTYLETEWSGDANRRARVGDKASKAV